jgi:AcrR family transcriptional regulator
LRPDQVVDHVNGERILEEGWKMFQQKGYRGVSIDALCARCELTKPTLYYYFGNKENLFVQVLRHRLSGFHKAIEEEGSISERLERTALAILESFQTEYSSLLRDREHITDPANREQIREAFHTELFDPLAVLMQAGVNKGELRAEKPEILVLLFLGMLNNFIGRAAEPGADRPALARLVTSYFLHGAAVR